MNKVIPSPKTYAIRNFLSHCVRMQGAKPTRLMTEEALCKEFSVNRETVRNAIQDLVQSGAVMRIPGKKGIYSNPLFSNSGTKSIGLVNGRPGEPYIHPLQSLLFAKLIERIGNDLPLIFQFPLLSESPEQVATQLPHYAFDLVLWAHFSEQHDFWLDSLDPLIRSGFPLIVVNMLNNGFPQKETSANMIGIDLKGLAGKKARFLRDASAGKLLYICIENASTHYFQEAFQRENPTRELAIFSSRSSSQEELVACLQQEKPESIFCEGGADRYRALLQAVSSNPSFGEIRCFLADNGESVPLVKEFSSVEIRLSGELDLSPSGIADELAKRIRARLSGETAPFKNILVF